MLAKKQEEMRDADCEIAMECAIAAERDACQAIVDTIESMCVNEKQKTVAAAIITAAMIEKFSSSTIITGPEFAKAVNLLRKHMNPTTEAFAREARDKYFKSKSRTMQFVEIYNAHPVIGSLSVIGLTWLTMDILAFIDALIRMAGG